MTSEKEQKYEYIGPDGAKVNAAIESDRNTPNAERRTSSKTLATRAKSKVFGEHTSVEVVKALGQLEARKHEGRE